MDLLLGGMKHMLKDLKAQQEFVKIIWSCTKEGALSIKELKLKSPCNITMVNHLSTMYKEQDQFREFDILTNVFPSQLFSEFKYQFIILYGTLMVSDYHGLFLIYDGETYIHLKFMKQVSNLSAFDNSFVLIKKHVLVTETLLDETYVPLEYILVDEDDVKVVFNNPQLKTIHFYDKTVQCKSDLPFVYWISTNRISNVLFGHRGKPECYIEAVVRVTGSERSFVAFIILSEEFLKVSKFLKPDTVYQVYSRKQWLSAGMRHYPELQRLHKTSFVVELDADSVIQETGLTPQYRPKDVISDDFFEVKDQIANSPNYGTLSFELRVYKKTMKTKAFAPYFPARHENMPYFGDMGYTEQTLVFCDKESNQYIDLYMANRDNHVVDFGLVANAVVRVNHAQVVKRRYVKSTIFTTFEVVKYIPAYEYTSANFLMVPDYGLCTMNNFHPATLLGCYERIPVGTVVEGIVFFRALFDLRMRVTKENADSKPDIAIQMIVEVEDGCNEKFCVEICLINFLLEILGWTSQRHYDEFMRECHNIFAEVNINFLKVTEEEANGNEDSTDVLRKVVWLVRTYINFKQPIMLRLLCLKQPPQLQGKPYIVLACQFLTKIVRPTRKLSEALFPKLDTVDNY